LNPELNYFLQNRQATCPYRAPVQACPRSSHMVLRSILVFTLPSISKYTTWLLFFMFTKQKAVRIFVPHVGHTHLITHFTTAPEKQCETWINNTAKQGATLRTPGPVYVRKSSFHPITHKVKVQTIRKH